MADTVISLRHDMQRRRNFEHPLLDSVGQYKLSPSEGWKALDEFMVANSQETRDALILGYMWIVKDLVCRFLSYWPEVTMMTDDLVSEGLHALTEYVDSVGPAKSENEFFNGAQQFIHGRMRDYVNYNRSMFAASSRTNWSRKQHNEPLEYNFTVVHNDELTGKEDSDPGFIDILDAIETLQEADREEFHDLVTHFLQHDHNIMESDLTDAEREALDKLSHLVLEH